MTLEILNREIINAGSGTYTTWLTVMRNASNIHSNYLVSHREFSCIRATTLRPYTQHHTQKQELSLPKNIPEISTRSSRWQHSARTLHLNTPLYHSRTIPIRKGLYASALDSVTALCILCWKPLILGGHTGNVLKYFHHRISWAIHKRTLPATWAWAQDPDQI